MKMINDSLKELWLSEDGQGMVEYALILALIAVVAMLMLTPLGSNISDKFKEISDKIKPTTPTAQ